MLRGLNEKGVLQLEVLTLPSLQGHAIEEVAIRIFDQWKLGTKETDKGILFVIVPSEHKMRIEVGRGLEGEVPDVIAKRIIADVVAPYFRQGRYDAGVLAGVVEIVRAVDPQALDQDFGPRERSPRGKGLPVWVILLILFILFLRFISGGGGGFGRRGPFIGGFGGGGFGGGGFGGGGWSGGGGSSNGGGASGGW